MNSMKKVLIWFVFVAIIVTMPLFVPEKYGLVGLVIGFIPLYIVIILLPWRIDRVVKWMMCEKKE